MAVVETLDVILAAKTAQFNKDMQKETDKIRKMKKEVEQISSTGTVFKDGFSEFAKAAPVVGGVSSNLMSVAGNLASAGAVAGPIGIAIAGSFAVATAGIAGTVSTVIALKNQMDKIDDLADAATRIGVSFQELQTLRFSFGESIGLGGPEVDGQIAKFQKSLIDASAKSGDQLNMMFAKVGLNAGELLRRGPVKALDEVSQKMQSLSEIDQMRLAFELFGKGGLEVVTALNEISEKSREIDSFLTARGIKLSDSQVAAVGAANDAWDRVALTVDNVVSIVAAEFAPIFSIVADSINESSVGLKGWTSSIGQVITGATYLTGVLYDAYEVITITYRTWQNIANADFSKAAEDIKSAMDFTSGQQWVDRLQKERMEAMDAANQAKQKRAESGQKQSRFEGIADQAEKEKADAKAAFEEKKQQERELAQMKKQQELEAKRAREDQAREKKRQAEQEAAEQKRQHDEMWNRVKSLRTQFNPALEAQQKIAELDDFRKHRLISQQTFEAGVMDATKGLTFEAGVMDATKGLAPSRYKGAGIAAEQGSVEAYKILLEKENGQNQNMIMRKIAEQQLQATRDLVARGVVLKPAR